ncbi:MAG: hypothetical protein MZV65_20385 [Chromatiales bacterium]|nr:hypothetical protein [Chromatiales bacterium]
MIPAFAKVYARASGAELPLADADPDRRRPSFTVALLAAAAGGVVGGVFGAALAAIAHARAAATAGTAGSCGCRWSGDDRAQGHAGPLRAQLRAVAIDEPACRWCRR